MKLMSFSFLLAALPLSSLMFTPQEVTHIQQERTKKHRSNNPHAMHCDGILYENKETWSLWLNGQKFTSKTPQPSNALIRIIAVTPDRVTLQWHCNEKRHDFSLKTNEGYDAESQQ